MKKFSGQSIHLSEKERHTYGEDAAIVSKQDDRTVYRIENDTGEVVMTQFSVFPGIDLVYNDVHMDACSVEHEKIKRMIEINHCREGRIECGWRDEFFYLSPGDTSIAYKEDAGHSAYFPIHHYHGISVMIELDSAAESLRGILDDVDVSPTLLAEKFCTADHCCVMRNRAEFDHIFSELYHVPPQIQKGYFKVKILELLLFLTGMELESQTGSLYTAQQVALAKSVCSYLTKHMDKRVTLAQLTEVFHVSGTHLKNCFKGVYGDSIYAFMKAQKMQLAALRLREDCQSVAVIAGGLGYDNSSKFAKAFQDVMGMTPTEYRRSSSSV